MDRSENGSPHLAAIKIAGVYAIFGIMWILFSDRFVERISTSPTQLTRLQTIKGWAFVFASAVILHGMVVYENRRLINANEELETALQQVHILHRILRHNLRNICTVIGGSIHELERTFDDGSPEPLTVLDEQNRRLITLSEKSRVLRDFVQTDSGKRGEYDLVEMVEDAVETARARARDATIEVTAPDSAFVTAHYNVGKAIEELVENAIVHNGSADPTVRVTVTPGATWTTLRVEDDGPGIPTNEQEALEQLYETSLKHSRGLGLWLVQLTIDESDGELEIQSGERGGSTVVVELPTAKP